MMITLLRVIRTAVVTTSMMMSVVVFVVAHVDCKYMFRGETGSQRN